VPHLVCRHLALLLELQAKRLYHHQAQHRVHHPVKPLANHISLVWLLADHIILVRLQAIRLQIVMDQVPCLVLVRVSHQVYIQVPFQVPLLVLVQVNPKVQN
jgi:hypothetical protein